MPSNIRTPLSGFFVAVSLASACAMLLASGAPAGAVDHPLAGTRLVAKARNSKQSFVWVSKDAQVVLPAASPTSAGATLSAKASGEDAVTVPLGASYWRENYTGSRARYSNSAAPGGDSVCRLAVITGGKIVKVTCRDDLIDTLDAGAEGVVDVVLSIGADRYCASFGGVVRDETGTFVAANAPAPVECPPEQPTTTVTCPPTTTTTTPVCGELEQCGESYCPFPQTCDDQGLGECGCTGAPVPCGDVYPVSLCGLGDCPPGLECGMLHHDVPECFNECACQ